MKARTGRLSVPGVSKVQDSKNSGGRPTVARVVAPTFGLDDPSALESQRLGKFDVRLVRAPKLGSDPYPLGPPGTEAAADPSRWFGMAGSPGPDPGLPLKALCERALRNEGIRLVHADCGATAPMASRIRRAYKLPLVVSFAGSDVRLCSESRRGVATYQGIFRDAFAVTAGSEFVMEKLLEANCPAKKIIQLRRGVDLDRYRYTPREPVRGRNVRFLFVGDLTQTSGIEMTIRSFAEVHEVERLTELQVVGDGALRSAMQDLVCELGLTDAISLRGVQSLAATREAMYASDLFVLPLRTGDDDSFRPCPTALIQAQATGLPAISTLHAEVPEFITHGQAGLLCNERDVAGLAGNMLWMVKHSDVWADMGWAGHARMFENHDIRRCSRRLESIYSAALTAAAIGRKPGNPTYQ